MTAYQNAILSHLKHCIVNTFTKEECSEYLNKHCSIGAENIFSTYGVELPARLAKDAKPVILASRREELQRISLEE